MAMFFRCNLCGNEHLARIQMPKETFESPTTNITKSSCTCPTTGQVTTCDKADLFWKDARSTPASMAAYSPA